jgi:uncharacterized protein (TIGR02145 family)
MNFHVFNFLNKIPLQTSKGFVCLWSNSCGLKYMPMKRNNEIWFRFFAIGVLIIFTGGCEKDDIPLIVTADATEILSSSAIFGGNISSDGGAKIKSRGVCWNTEGLPTIDDNITSDREGSGSFTSNITELTPNTTYSVRAYATNRKGTSYGDQIVFKTFESTAYDIDGNAYPVITIGTQIWMATNLKVTHYRNGDLIPNVTDENQWENLTTGAYCDYNYTDLNSKIFGKLYNWYAVNDGRCIAPVGWHVPNDAEWTTLTNYCGGEFIAANRLKEQGTKHWSITGPITNSANNETRFTALPGGDRDGIGLFHVLGKYGYWWTSSENGSNAWYRSMCNYSTEVGKGYTGKTCGYSVRCVKD